MNQNYEKQVNDQRKSIITDHQLFLNKDSMNETLNEQTKLSKRVAKIMKLSRGKRNMWMPDKLKMPHTVNF